MIYLGTLRYVSSAIKPRSHSVTPKPSVWQLLFIRIYLRATERRLPYEMTQCSCHRTQMNVSRLKPSQAGRCSMHLSRKDGQAKLTPARPRLSVWQLRLLTLTSRNWGPSIGSDGHWLITWYGHVIDRWSSAVGRSVNVLFADWKISSDFA